MKALTLYQPWAGLVIYGPKRWENRNHSRFCWHRGPLAIHAARREKYVEGVTTPLGRRLKVPAETMDEWVAGPEVRSIPFSAILGVVDVVDGGFIECFPSAENDVFAEGPYVLKLDNPRALPTPIQCPGHQGLWTVPDDVERKIIKQLEAMES